MTIQMTATEAKAKLLSALDQVAAGEEIEITRHGRTVARIVSARGASSLRGLHKGRVRTVDPDDDLLTANAEGDWECS